MITQQTIDAQIIGEEYHVFPRTTRVVCCLYLRNGSDVTGEHSSEPALARSNARDKIWALEKYAERSATTC